MIAVIVRHGRVKFGWGRWSTSSVFDTACREYDKAPLAKGFYSVPKIVYRKIYSSTLPRSIKTVRRLFPGTSFIKTTLINEVPIRSSVDSGIRLPLWFWSITGALQWFFNRPRQKEGYRQTKERAKRFAAMICREGVNCLVVTHGFFMHTLLSEMRKAGFQTIKTHIGYKNGEYVVAIL